MALLGADIAALAQAAEDAAQDDRIGVHRLRQHLGGDRPMVLGHVQQHVQHAGQSTVSSHATSPSYSPEGG